MPPNVTPMLIDDHGIAGVATDGPRTVELAVGNWTREWRDAIADRRSNTK